MYNKQTVRYERTDHLTRQGPNGSWPKPIKIAILGDGDSYGKMPGIPRAISYLQRWGRQVGTQTLLLGLVLAMGIFARAWEFGRLPPGLNADEASIGVEAYDLAHFGIDRNGVSYPVHFIAWGSGQNALYGYLLVPFVALLGLSPIVVRLPMLLAGIASLPLIYLVGTMTFNRQVGLAGTFLLAISPWHILLSRWGLESNFLPFVFLLAYACLLLGLRRRAWLYAACLLFGISLYAYGTAYAVVPVFIIFALVVMTRGAPVQPRELAIGMLLFIAVAAPISLFLVINSLRLPSIALGPMTIPRLPVEPRFETASLLGQGDAIHGISDNLSAGVGILLGESDGIIYNVLDPFGTSYHVGLALAVAGLAVLMTDAKLKGRVESLLLVGWLGSALMLIFLEPLNVNRFNIVFLPLLLLGACAVYWLANHSRLALGVIVLLLLGVFAAFTISYHGPAYQRQMSQKFHAGLLSALHFAEADSSARLCITDEINMPYIFALFTEHASPADYLSSVRYVDEGAPMRQVISYGRYVFGTQNCTTGDGFTYVLTKEEIPPRLGNRYAYEFFDNFVVYYPKR